MAEYRQKLIIDAQMNINNIKSAMKGLQSTLSGFKLDDKMSSQLTDSFKELEKELEKYDELTSKGANNPKETAAIEKQWQKVSHIIDSINKQSGKIAGLDPKKLIPNDAFNRVNELKKQLQDALSVKQERKDNRNNVAAQVEEAKVALDQLKARQAEITAPSGNKENLYTQLVADIEKAEKAADEAAEKLASIRKNSEAKASDKYKAENDVASTKKELNQLLNQQKAYQKEAETLNTTITQQEQKFQQLKQALTEANKGLGGLPKGFQEMRKEFATLSGQDLDKIPKTVEGLSQAMDDFAKKSEGHAAAAMGTLINKQRELAEAQKGTNEKMDEFHEQGQNLGEVSSQIDRVANSITHFFSLANALNMFNRAVRQAITATKELDAAFTEIAVVSDYTVRDVWKMRTEFVDAANGIGASTTDLVSATTLYVQQGLSLEEAQKVAVETMKMGRIANLEGKDATDLMTAAIRGYKMELTDASHVNDVYSNLAAKSASDTEELAIAMSKTASTAYTSGASFENMSAFLAQIIETTREAPETAGTAMKTIISRFQELKNAVGDTVEVDGEVVSVNKVEKALATAGVALRNANGEFRAFDDVILELSSKWDDLDVMTQRYIATIAAGSRQQSRFLALLNDNKRLTELVGYANNSAGASAEQFAKTQDSLQAAINRLTNAWDLFLTGFANNKLIHAVIEVLTQLLNTVNVVFSGLNNSDNILANLIGGFGQLTMTVLAFIAASRVVTTVVNGLSKAIIGQTVIHNENQKSIISIIKSKYEEAKARLKDAAAIEVENKARQASVTGDVMEDEEAAWAAEAKEQEARARIKNAAATTVEAGAQKAEEQATHGVVAAKLKEWAIKKKILVVDAAGQATLAPLLLALTAIALIVGGSIVVYELYQNRVHGAARAQERLRKESEKLREESDELKQEIDDLNSALESIDQDKEILDNLVEGSAEWYAQLVKVNDQILSIIEKYPELAQYMEVGTNGELSLNTQGVEQFQEQQAQEVRANQISQMANQYKIAGLDSEVLAEDFLYQGAGREMSMAYNIDTKQIDKVIATLNAKGQKLADLTADQIDQVFTEAGVQIQANARGREMGLDNTTIGAYLKSRENDQQFQQLMFKSAASDKAAQEALRQSVFSIVTEGVTLDQGSETFIKERFKTSFEEAIEQGLEGEALVNFLTEAVTGQSGSIEEFQNLQRVARNLDKNPKAGAADQTEALQKVLDIYSGNFNIEAVDENIEDLWKSLDPQLQAILTDLGIEEDILKQQLDSMKSADEENKTRLTELGMSDVSSQLLGAENRQNLLNMMNTSGMTEDMQKATAQSVTSVQTFEKLQKVIGNIDFTDPIQSFSALTQAMQSGDEVLMTWARNMDSTGEVSITQGIESIVNELNSGEEDLASIIKTEGKISSAKVKELADSSFYLSEMLELGIVNGEQAAKILTHIGEGGNIEGYTNQVIELIGAIDGLSTGHNMLDEFMSNFEGGFNENQGIEFLDKQMESIEGYIDQGLYANSDLRAKLSAFFQIDDPTSLTREQVIDYYNQMSALMENEGYGFWQQVAEQTAEGSELWVENLGNGLMKLHTVEGMGYEEIVNNLAELTGTTDDVANAMLLNYAQRDTEFAKAIEGSQAVDAAQKQKERLDKMYPKGGGALVYTAEEQEAMRAGMGQENYQTYAKELQESGHVVIAVDTVDAETGEPLNGLELLQKVQRGLDSQDAHVQVIPTVDEEEKVIEYDYEAAVELMPSLTQEQYDEAVQMLSDMHPDFTVMKGQATVDISDGVTEGVKKLEDQELINQVAAPLGTAVQTEVGTGLDTAWSNFVTKVGQTTLTIAATIEADMPNGGSANGTPVGGARYNGLGLVGERGYELYQNARTGVANLVGINGPELTYLNKGDRIYTHSQTRDMLRGAKIPGFASGTNNRKKVDLGTAAWDLGGGSGSGSSSGSGSGSGSSASAAAKEATDATEAWISAYDWLYNLVERTNEEVRRGNRLEHEREKLLRDSTASAQDLLRIYQQQMDSLIKQQQYWQEQHDKRLEEAERIENEYKDLMQYAYYDENAGTVVINNNLIDAQSGVADKEWGDRLDEYIDKLEDISDKIDDTEDELMDIEDQIYELQKLGQEEFLDLEKRVIDAIKARRQEAIDQAQDLSDAVNDSNEALLNRISDGISDYRDARESEEEKSDIEAMERRLALMQSDTSGANALDIMKLREEIDEKREDYTDSLIDKSIDEMTRQNEEAYEQRQKQIDLMQAQLDWDYESGQIALLADKLLVDAMNAPGTKRSEKAKDTIYDLLKDNENFYESGVYDRLNYLEELGTTWNSALIWWTNYMGGFVPPWYVYGTLTDEEGKVLFDTPNWRKFYADGKTGEDVLRDWNPQYVGAFNGSMGVQNLDSLLRNMSAVSTNNYVINMDNQISSDYDVERLWPQLKRAIEKESTQYNPTTLNFKNRR